MRGEAPYAHAQWGHAEQPEIARRIADATRAHERCEAAWLARWGLSDELASCLELAAMNFPSLARDGVAGREAQRRRLISTRGRLTVTGAAVLRDRFAR